LERKTLDLSAKLGNFAIKRQATWGMSVYYQGSPKQFRELQFFDHFN
jgi:hypothetical protein